MQNPHVMLPEAAKKVRYLRSDFKRRMEADGKAMSPEERCVFLISQRPSPIVLTHSQRIYVHDNMWLKPYLYNNPTMLLLACFFLRLKTALYCVTFFFFLVLFSLSPFWFGETKHAKRVSANYRRTWRKIVSVINQSTMGYGKACV